MKALQVIVSGRVQGVGYRAWTEEAAKARQLTGWVRNRRDGSVEALLGGDDAAVDELVGLLWQGPLAAQVERVASQRAEMPTGLGFRVLPTA